MKVIWTDPAIEELVRIHDYVSLDSPTAARALIERIVNKSEQMARFPNAGRIVPEYEVASIREVQEHPYRIIYLVGNDQVEVLAVVHGARKLPGQEPAR